MKEKTILYYLLFGILFFTIISISGCISTGQKFTVLESPPANMSVVYFYRVNKLLTNSTIPAIKDNGNEILSGLPAGTFWKYYISPGKHTFEPKQFGLFKKETTAIDSKVPGEIHFVELSVDIGYIGLIKRSKDVALSRIADCFEVSSK